MNKQHWEVIRTENVAGFEIVFAVAPEEDNPRDHFDDEGETARGIAEGRFDWFVARVEARREGITLGTDYLGACCYESAEQFCDDDYYGDMVERAVDEARATLAKLCAAA